MVDHSGSDFTITDVHPDAPPPAEVPHLFEARHATRYHQITDVNHGMAHHRAWGNVDHRRYDHRTFGHFTTSKYGGGYKRFSGPAVMDTGGSFSGLSGSYSFDPPQFFELVAEKSDQLIESMTTQIAESFNLAIDIWEAGDLKKIIPEFRHVLQVLGDLLLSWNFAVKPTFQDMQKLLGPAFTQTRDRIDFLRRNNGKRVKSSRQGNFMLDEKDYPAPYRVVESSRPGLFLEWRPYVVSCTYNLYATAELKLSGLDNLTNVVDAYAAAFGLLNPIKTIWEHVPYSFILDWFVNLKDFFNAVGGRPFDGTIEIVDSHCTTRIAVLSELYQYRDGFENVDLLPPHNTGSTIVTSTYRRTKGLPMAGRFSSDISPLQELLLGAMLRQRIPNL